MIKHTCVSSHQVLRLGACRNFSFLRKYETMACHEPLDSWTARVQENTNDRFEAAYNQLCAYLKEYVAPCCRKKGVTLMLMLPPRPGPDTEK